MTVKLHHAQAKEHKIFCGVFIPLVIYFGKSDDTVVQTLNASKHSRNLSAVTDQFSPAVEQFA